MTATLAFKDLVPGDVFEFTSEFNAALGLATGPWRKLSARTYAPLDDRWNGAHTRIGTVHCPVMRVGTVPVFDFGL